MCSDRHREGTHEVATSDSRGADGEPLTQYIANAVRRQILDGDLRPGKRLVQDAIARQYGTSRIPVREALRELASEGLIEIVPDSGARVKALDAAELIEVYMMREVLEPLAVLQAAPHFASDDLQELSELLDKSEACARSNDLSGYQELDRTFHKRVFECAELPRLHQVISSLWNTAHQYQAIYTRLPRKLEFSIIEHRLLLNALERRIAEDAAQIHLLHIRRTRLSLLENSQLFPDRASTTLIALDNQDTRLKAKPIAQKHRTHPIGDSGG